MTRTSPSTARKAGSRRIRTGLKLGYILLAGMLAIAAANTMTDPATDVAASKAA